MQMSTTTTPFDMAVMNDLDRFHLVLDVIDRIPLRGSQADYAKQALRDKRIEHKQYIAEYGQDMPEISQWSWSNRATAATGSRSRRTRPAVG